MKQIKNRYLVYMVMFSMVAGMFFGTVIHAKDIPNENDIMLIYGGEDYLKYDFEDLGIYYTPEALTEFHMPFIVDADYLKLKDKNNLSGDVSIKTKSFNERFKGYNFDILAVNGKYAVIDYSMSCLASVDSFNVDFVPVINKVPYDKFAWWNSSWFMNKQFTINHSMIDDVLVNFPVLVKIPSYLGAYCDNGDSIRFVSMDNSTEYSFEFDVWNSSDESLIWVKIPVIYSDIDTHFMMYYNNSNVVSGEDAVNVWDSYEGVWHLNKNNATHTFDSTSNSFHGALNSVSENNIGIIGNCFDFDGVNDFINIGDNLDVGKNDYSFEIWFKPNAAIAMSLIRKETGGPTWEGYRFDTSALKFYSYLMYNLSANQYCSFVSTDSTTINVTHYSGVSVDRDSFYNVYLDGGLNSGAITGALADVYGLDIDVVNNLYFGSNGGTAEFFNGTLDEIRISFASKDANWFKASYENVVNYSDFMSASNVHYYESGDTVIDGELDVTLHISASLAVLGLWMFVVVMLYKTNRKDWIVAVVLGLCQMGLVSVAFYSGLFVDVMEIWLILGVAFLGVAVIKVVKGRRR